MTESLALARPLALLGLALVALYGLWRWRALGRDAVPYAPLQFRRPRTGRRRLGRLLVPAEMALLAAVVVAIAGPYRETRLELFEDEGIDIVLALDVSLSMLATDFPPTRLDALRRIAGDFIARVGGDRVGLMIFARDAFVQTPLTTDRAVIEQLLAGVTVHTIDQDKSGGTAIGDALLAAAEFLDRGRVEGRDQALILITDGESNMGSEPALGARYLRHLGIDFAAIGIGGEEPVQVLVDGEPLGGDTPYLAYLDDAELRGIAELAGGSYYRATDVGALEAIFAELSRLERAPLEVRTVVSRRYYASLLAVPTLVLFVLHLVLAGHVLRRPLR